jgi:hypothetical protein
VLDPVAGDLRLLAPTTTARPTFAFTRDLEQDGTRRRFRLHWAQLPQRWLLDAERSDGVVICRGFTVVLGVSLLAPFAGNPATPLGQLFALAGDRISRTPDRGDLPSGLVSIYYRPAALVAAQVGQPGQLW